MFYCVWDWRNDHGLLKYKFRITSRYFVESRQIDYWKTWIGSHFNFSTRLRSHMKAQQRIDSEITPWSAYKRFKVTFSKSGPPTHRTFVGMMKKQVLNKNLQNIQELETGNISPQLYSILVNYNCISLHSIIAQKDDHIPY